jgi:hypothetical protein
VIAARRPGWVAAFASSRTLRAQLANRDAFISGAAITGVISDGT